MILLRFSTDEYITRLQKEGQIYCRSIQSFAKDPYDMGRGDDYENVFEQIYFDGGELRIKPENVPDDKVIKLSVNYQTLKMMSNNHYVNVFCLYALNPKDYNPGELFELSDEIKKMGTHCLIITRVPEFLARVRQAMIDRNFECEGRLVDYKDFSKYTGKRTIFEKPIQYNFQKEYRIAIRNNNEFPIDDLFIGNIEAISYKLPVSDLKNLSIEYIQND